MQFERFLRDVPQCLWVIRSRRGDELGICVLFLLRFVAFRRLEESQGGQLLVDVVFPRTADRIRGRSEELGGNVEQTEGLQRVSGYEFLSLEVDPGQIMGRRRERVRVG